MASENVNKIIARAGAAKAASAVPVPSSGKSGNAVNDIISRAKIGEKPKTTDNVSAIMSRASAKPVEPEWQAAMFGGTPRYTLSDERYKGILDVDESTGKISVNANAAQTAREQFLNYNNLMNSATDEAQKNQYRESRDWYRGVLDELGVQDKDVLNVQLDERRNALNAAQAEYDNVMLQYGIDQSGASNDILNAASAKLSQAEMDYNKVLGKDRERAMGEFTGGLQTDISNVAGLLKIADTTRRESDLSKKELLEQRRDVNEQLDQIRASLRAEGKTEDEIDSLFNYYRQMNSAEERKTAEEEARAAAENRSDFGNWFANTALGITSGVGAVDIGVQKIVNDIRGKDAITGQDRVVDYNSAWQSPYYISEAIMQGEMDKITKENGGTEWADSRAGFIRANGYQLAVSMGQSAAVAGLSAMGVPAATLLLGGSAATSTMQEFHDLGYSDGQAIAMGVAAGFAEYITEKYSLESLMSMRSVNGLKGKEAVKVVLGNIFRQTLTEGSEEMASDFVNLAADCLINGDMSKNKMRIQELIAQGMDPEEARKQVEREWLSQLMQDGIMGAISGGLFGGGGMAINAAATNAGYNAAGKTIITEQTQKTLQNKIAGLDDTIVKAVRADAEIDTESRKSLGRAADALGRSEMAAAVQEQMQAAGEKASPELISGILAMARNERLLAAEKNAVRQSENAKAIAEQLGEAMQEKFNADNAWAQRPVYAAMKASSGMMDGIPAPEVDLGPSLNYDGIPAPRVALAGEEIGPDTRPLTMNNAPAGAEAMNEGGIINGTQMDTAGAERMGDNGTGIQSEGDAGSISERQGADQRGTAEGRRDRAVNLREVGSDEVTPGGAKDGRVKVSPQEMWDDEMKAVAEQAYKDTGLPVTYVIGDFRGEKDGVSFEANACISDAGIVIRADHPTYTVQQLYDHEDYHANETEEMNRAARQKIVDTFTEEEFRRVAEIYAKYLPGYSEAQILSEILADAHGNMNAFAGTDVTRFTEIVDQNRALFQSGQEQENGTRETRGPTEWSRDKEKVKELKKGEGRPYYNESDKKIYIYDNDANAITRESAISEASIESVRLYGEKSPFSEGFLERITNNESPLEDVTFTVLEDLKNVTKKDVFETVRDSDEIFHGNASNDQTGMQIFVGAEGIEDTGIYAERKNAVDQAKALSGIKQLIENAVLIGTSETKIDVSKKLKKRNNPQRLFQYVFASPFNMGNGRKIAVIRVDALYTGNKNTLNKFYNLNSVEIIGASSDAAYSGFQAGQASESAPAITVAEMVSHVNPEVVGNHVQIEKGEEKYELIKTPTWSRSAENPDKQKQYDIVTSENAMRDDIHTGIRSVEDIRTFDEALDYDGISEGDSVTPDYTAEMIRKAKKSGKITVYSSKPIKAGGFVTPSEMEARSYAGSGPIYSQEVSLADVAWIDSVQGQYAPASKSTWSRGGENLLTEEGPEETASTTEMPTSTTETPEAKQQAEAKDAMYETADALAESGIEESVDVEDLMPEERPDKLTAKLFGIDIEKEQEAEVKSKAIEDMAKILEEYPTPFDMYAEQSPVKKDPGADPTDPTDGKVQTKVEQEKKTPGQKLRDFWRGFRREMVNAGEAVHRAIKVNGDTALDGYYFNAMASRSRAGNWVTNQRMSYDMQQSGKGLNEILDPIRKKGEDYYEAFQIYLLHKLNVERMSRDRGYDLREAQRRLTAFVNQNADIAAMSRDDLRYYAGLILEEGDEGYALKKARRELANEYLELIAARDEAERSQNKPVFGYEVTAEMSLEKARMAEVDHPEFKEMAEEVYAYSKDLLQYRVDAGLISQEDMDKLTGQYPHYIPVFYDSEGTEQKIHSGGVTVSTAIKRARGGDGKILPLHTALARQTSTVMHNVGMNDFGKRLMFNVEQDKEGMKPFVTNIEETPVRWETDYARNDDVLQPNENVISIIQDGKRYDLTLTKEMAAAFQMMKPGQENNAAIEAIGKATNLFKALCTSYSPTFMLTNPIRDVQDALFYSKDTKAWVENYPQAWKEIVKSGKYWQMYKAMGGVYGSYFDWLTGESTEGKSKVMNKIEQLNMWIEQAPRLAEFMATVKAAETDGKVSQDVLMEAFHNAQEITTNFGQSGGKTAKTLNKIVPFWNAGVQGADKFFRTVTEKKSFAAWGSLVLKAAAFGMLPEILNGLFYRKDEEWDIIDDDMKVNYYLFKGKDGQWIKIPKGRVLATLSTPVVGAMEGMRGDKVDWGELGKTALGNIAPNNPLETNIFSTAMQARLFDKDDPGKNWYGGDIESKRLQSYAPGERYDESTDYISKWIGKVTNLSPKKINYIIDQYSGVIGDLVLPMLTPRAEEGLYIGNYREPLLSMFVSRFTTDTVRSNDISDGYYDLLDELGYRSKNGDDSAKLAEKYMNSAGSTISDLYAQIREIENDTELTGKEKTELTRELRKKLNTVQQEATEEAERYLDAAKAFLADAPELDYTDGEAVKAWMEQYNAEQTAPTAKLTEEQAQKKMEAEVYRELNRQQFGAEYALEKYNGDVYDKAQELNEESGIDYEAFYDYYFGKSALRDDKDAQGRTISGTKMEKVVELIDGLDIPDEQKDALYYDAGYSDSKIYNTPWHGGDGSFAKANKEWEIAEDKEKRDAWVQSYLTSRPEIDYTDTATVRAWMEQYNAEQSAEEYYTDLAGAASKMRSEVEREADKALYGADYALHKYSEDVWEKAQGLNVNYQLAYEDYYDFYFQSLKCYSDKDENGKSISGSKKAKIVDLIDSMAVTDDQKDGLFLAAGYTESGLKGTPWHGGKSSSGRSGGGGRRGGSRSRSSGKRSGKAVTDSIRTTAAGKTGGDGWGLTEDGRIWIEPPQIGDFDMSAMQKAQEIVDKYDDNDIWAALWSHYAKPTTDTGFKL